MNSERMFLSRRKNDLRIDFPKKKECLLMYLRNIEGLVLEAYDVDEVVVHWRQCIAFFNRNFIFCN